jgi:hypothetical protein
MRLFRQAAAGEWEPVVERVVSARGGHTAETISGC